MSLCPKCGKHKEVIFGPGGSCCCGLYEPRHDKNTVKMPESQWDNLEPKLDTYSTKFVNGLAKEREAYKAMCERLVEAINHENKCSLCYEGGCPELDNMKKTLREARALLGGAK